MHQGRAGFFHRLVFAAAGVGAAFWGMAAHAQAVPPGFDQQAAFNRLLLSPTMQTFIATNVNALENPVLKAECPSLKVLEANRYDIVQRPVFEQNGQSVGLKSGVWVSMVKVERCGQPTMRRLLIKYEPDQKRFQAIPLLPGDFRGNLQLEVDARRIVIPGVMALAKCSDGKQVFALDVRSGGPSTAEGWSESWRLQTCGRKATVTVLYRKVGDGMDITGKDIKVE
ncbi:hypothetical protein [Azorhizobium oxalatiphilum]|uniref:hypothetical protein n=1 Tax=Azorhizobium oxalatiphilum TaxID=980631 RepID=UPI00166CD8A1|nr:hypothetical protein [Azorhizobium oxalatiphilum]